MGGPELLVLGRHRLGFGVASQGAGSRLRVFIAYDLPRSGLGQALGRLGARASARW